MTEGAVRRLVVGLAVLSGGLALTVLVHSLAWVGRPFPGFFIMKNRVVPSVALPGWSGEASQFYQREVVAMDGTPIRDARQAYAAAAALPAGAPVVWELRAPNGEHLSATVPIHVFTAVDYVLLFGAYLIVGCSFGGTALWVAYVKTRNVAALGVLSAQMFVGLFAVTGMDLYGPNYWFVPLHVLAEVMMAPSLVHLALVFPTPRLGARRRPLLQGLYGVFGLFAAVYEWLYADPTAYPAVHLAASAFQGVGTFVFVAACVYAVFDPSPIVRRRVGVVAFGGVIGCLLPACAFAATGLLGGRVPVNVTALVAWVFPLTVGYAAVKQDLFEIDVFIRRATTYAMVIVCVAAIYLVVLAAGAMLLPGRDLLEQSPVALAAVNLALLFCMAPIQRRVQSVVDRVYFRQGYDADVALGELSDALASAFSLHDVVDRTQRLLARTVMPETWAVYVVAADGGLRRAGGTGGPSHLFLPAAVAARAERGDLVTRFESDVAAADVTATWSALGADLLVPIRTVGPPIAVLVLGPRASGRDYTAQDGALLRAAASQVALGLRNAKAFEELEELNASLELQVRERTAALETANVELNVSVSELRAAYQQLERNQASLVRADRLATLGRLAAGIAHEMNTPLAAVQNSLKTLADLGQEYEVSLDDARVTPVDHREIAREIVSTATAASGWARKAAAFIAKVKLHARDAGAIGPQKFAVKEVVDETQALLMHRMRSAGCDVAVTVDPTLVLVGEQGRLGQVLVNLVGNAIDAYEDHALRDGRIEIRAERVGDNAVVTVRDDAGGIPDDVLPRIFDELYTTKEPGRGTGLGLWIARTLVEEQFGGTLTVGTEVGVGSCFTLTLPLHRPVPASAAA